MKRLPTIGTLVLLSVIIIAFSSFMPYQGGAPSPYYYSGSPSDGHDCSSCHGNASTANGLITSNIPVTGYVPGTTYQITATNSISGSGKYGFELSPQNAAGTLLGTLAAGTGSKLVGSKWITHSNASSSVSTWTFNWTAPSAGTGNVTFYASFARSTSSAVKNSTLTVSEAAVSLPGPAGPITGPGTLCAGSTNNYSVGTITGATSYVWSVPSGASIVSGQGTSSISVNFSSSASSGNISVYGSNTAGSGTPSTLPVLVNPLPLQTSVITGPTSVCTGSSASYSVENTPGIIYTWFFPSGTVIVAGQGSSTIEVTVGSISGAIEVVPSNGCGNGPGRAMSLQVFSVPAQPPFIEGPSSPCEGATVNYAVPNQSGVTFTWSVSAGNSIVSGQGTNSVLVLIGANGAIEVTPSNECGIASSQSKTFTLSSLPTQPGTISGIPEPCQGSSQVYSVDLMSGVTFNWGVPSGSTITSGQGTNSITVTIGPNSGNIELVASNDCGNSPVRTFYLTVQPQPGWAASISGPSQVYIANTPSSNYATSGAANATSYIWELTPADAGILTPAGLQAEVTWSVTFSGLALIRVKGVNVCGEGDWSDIKEVIVINNTGVGEIHPSGTTVITGPGRGQITIDSHYKFSFLDIQLIDLSGVVRFRSRIPGEGTSLIKTDLTPGIYLLRLNSDEVLKTSKIKID